MPRTKKATPKEKAPSKPRAAAKKKPATKRKAAAPSADRAPIVVMFDFDGVIADSADIFFSEWQKVCRELGFDKFERKEQVMKLLEGNPFIGLLRAGFPMRKLKALAERVKPRVADVVKTVPPFAGMPELVSRIADAHPTYVVTSNNSEFVGAYLEQHAVTGVIDVIGADVEPSKVKKIRRVRRKHPGHDPWYIGDTKGDMVEAKTARARAVAVTWGWHEEQVLQSADPDLFVNLPDDLRALFVNGGYSELDLPPIPSARRVTTQRAVAAVRKLLR